MRDKTLGGGGGVLRQILSEERYSSSKDRNDWCKEKTTSEKTESCILISQQHECGQVQTKVSSGKPRQDKQGQKKADT